jgi:hypothetical protein
VTGLLASPDGHVVIRHRAEGNDPVATGAGVARHLLEECGGSALLLAAR